METTIHKYQTGNQIGSTTLTVDQWEHYMSLAQQPEGVIALGDLPTDLYGLDNAHQHLPPHTTVYIDR